MGPGVCMCVFFNSLSWYSRKRYRFFYGKLAGSMYIS